MVGTRARAVLGCFSSLRRARCRLAGRRNGTVRDESHILGRSCLRGSSGEIGSSSPRHRGHKAPAPRRLRGRSWRLPDSLAGRRGRSSLAQEVPGPCPRRVRRHPEHKSGSRPGIPRDKLGKCWATGDRARRCVRCPARGFASNSAPASSCVLCFFDGGAPAPLSQRPERWRWQETMP
jgi:hypothetical protein